MVHNWPAPSNVEKVQSFHGFCSCYQRLVLGFATVCHPITQLTVKDAKFEECLEALTQLKEVLCPMLVLVYPDPEAAMLLDTDASNVEVGAVLSQTGADGKEWVLGYMSCALNHPEKSC